MGALTPVPIFAIRSAMTAPTQLSQVRNLVGPLGLRRSRISLQTDIGDRRYRVLGDTSFLRGGHEDQIRNIFCSAVSSTEVFELSTFH
jgi:hypothetical protein